MPPSWELRLRLISERRVRFREGRPSLTVVKLVPDSLGGFSQEPPVRHQRDRKGHKGEARSLSGPGPGSESQPALSELESWNLSRASVPEQAQSVAQSLPQVWGAAQLPEVGSEVSTSTAISGHEGHQKRLPATEDQFRVVPVEVHLYTEDNIDQDVDRSTFLPRTQDTRPSTKTQGILLPGQCHH